MHSPDNVVSFEQYRNGQPPTANPREVACMLTEAAGGFLMMASKLRLLMGSSIDGHYPASDVEALRRADDICLEVYRQFAARAQELIEKSEVAR